MTSVRYDATVSVHIVTLRWRQVWRAPIQVRIARRLCGTQDVRFAVCGRTSGGGGLRQVNRTLSLRRIIVVAEWASADAAIEGRRLFDTSWQQIADIWSAITINERFLFIRELFGNDAEGFKNTVTLLNSLNSWEAAGKFMSDRFEWDKNNQVAVDFLNVVRRRFLK